MCACVRACVRACMIGERGREKVEVGRGGNEAGNS